LFSLLFSFSPSFSLKEIKQNNKTREKNNKNVGEKKKKHNNMSNRGGGGSFVTIPKNVKKTIQSIREITGKQHSDEDIYSVLQDCAMDLDDTAQKLLYLGIFLRACIKVLF
jgi:hypothetical protein